MEKYITALLLIISFATFGQDTPYIKPVIHTNMAAAGYQFKQVKIDTSATIKKLLVRDSSAFQGVVTVPTLLDTDSSKKAANTAWVKKWIAENITPGIPGEPTPTWQFKGNYTPDEPTSGRLGFKDSTNLIFITNDQVRLIIPDNGIKRSSAAVNRVLVFDTVAKKIYYSDAGSGSGIVQSIVAGTNVTVNNTDPANPIISATGGGIDSSVHFTINQSSDSSYALFEKRNGAKDTLTIIGIAGGGGGGSSQWVTTGSDIYYNTGGVAIGATSVNSKSILDLVSTTKGFLSPRMTTTQRDAISSPTTGLQVFNNTNNTPNYYTGTSWANMGGSVYKTAVQEIGTSENLVSGKIRPVKRLIFRGSTGASGTVQIPLTGYNPELILSLRGTFVLDANFTVSIPYSDFSYADGDIVTTNVKISYRPSTNVIQIDALGTYAGSTSAINSTYVAIIEFQEN